MIHNDNEQKRKGVETTLERTWELFDAVQHYVSDEASPGHDRPDFAARAQELVPDSQDESRRVLDRANLEKVAELIHSCTSCQLSLTRVHAVPGEGVLNARLMVIGEGPGADEDTTGKPFVGRAGKYLDAWLSAINLSRTENTYITNIVKCRPPGNRDPLPEEVQACLPYLKRQIALVKPDAILCLGRVAAHVLLSREDALRDLRAVIHRFEGIPLVVTYHPAAVLRNLQLRAPVWDDLKRVAELVGMPLNRTGR